jgi:alpha-L-rhamnosidase
MKRTLLFFATLLLMPLVFLRAAEVTNLRCEYLKDPLGIDVMKPRLSWKLETGNLKLERGIKQTSYQILVASSENILNKDQGDLWDSGKVESDQSIHVEYQGKPLEPRMRCYWKVMVWTARTEVGGPSFALRATVGRQRSEDRKKEEVSGWSAPAMWEMGLLKPEDWSAKWIGEPAVSAGTNLDGVVINRATYRTLDGKVSADMTPVLKKALEEKRIPFHVDFNALGGDPAPNIVKELVVEYTCRGKSEESRAQDFSDLHIPGRRAGFPAPWFRGECELAAKPESAVVTVHSHAYFELYINGVKAGDDVLTPAVSHPQAQTFTVTYDVAHLLKPGKNCLGLWMGKGWADPIAVRAQLDAMVQGKKVTFGTGPEWKTRSSGYSHIGGWGWNNFGGERLDAAAHVPGWCLPGLDTASWSNAVEAPAPQGTALNHAVPLNRIGERIAAKEISPLADGRYEIDFGTNLTGWLRLKFPQLKTGQVVRLHFADRVFPGGVQSTPIGNITISEISCTAFPRNGGGHNLYQTYNQVSEFVSAGVPGEEFCNKFNYAGFRHVVVEGLNAAPRKEDATALLVETALPDAGAFECSDPLINRIHQANRWTLRCLNLGGYIVDCPHRERMGYGDGQVSLEGMMMNFDASRFYEKWGRDWRLAQNPGDGTMPNIAPPLCAGGGGPPWAGVIAALPWDHYLHYGDPRILEENIAAARRYVEYLDSRATAEVMRAWGDGLDFLGDWVPPRRGMDTQNWPTREMAELFCNCYRVYLWQQVENMAAALRRADEAEHARKRMAAIGAAVHAAYYDATNKCYVIDEQIYYAMPLLTGVTPASERAAVMANLVKCLVEKNKGHLDTGMLGTKFLLRFLGEAGRDDLVLRIYQQKDYPGWGYMVEQGATTLWEQWNGYWSQIHSCFASADTWLYQGLAGIRPDPAGAGFKHVIIRPAVVGDPPSSGNSGAAGLAWVKAHHDSPYGRIVSNWKLETGNSKLETGYWKLEITVPLNTTATVYVPAKDETGVTESGKPAAKAVGVKFLRMENNAAVYEVGSGTYCFQSSLAETIK